MITVTDDEYYQTHRVRFKQSVDILSKYITPDSNVLELGDPNRFTPIFRSSFKYGGQHNTWQDLRKPINYGDSVFDLVLCMELVEHIKDEEEGNKSYNETFYGTGQQRLLKECYRILKPNGVLFLTTPNLSSVKSLKQLLLYKNPYIYWNHVRELSVDDLKKYLTEAKFSIELFETRDSWHETTQEDLKLLKALKKFGYSSELRGDNLFIIAKKYE